MKSFTTPEFWHLYAALPPEAREQAKKAYRLGRENQFHPSLHFKKVGDNLWSVRVSRGYRALAVSRKIDYYWILIGSHDNYEELIK